MKTAKNLDGVKNSNEEKIYKTLPYEVKVVDDVKRTLIVAISTPNVDRSGDTMSMKGMVYKDYLNNPVVLEYHNYEKDPIATCENLTIKNDAIIATVKFPEEGKYPRSDEMYNMYKDKLLNAWSIGFKSLDSEYNQTGGRDFTSWELFEFSAVSVPDNPQALTILRSKGINVDLFIEKKETSKEEEVKEEEKKEEPVEKETPIEEAKEEEEKTEAKGGSDKKEAEKEEDTPVVEEEKSIAEELAETTLLSELNIAQFKKLLPQKEDTAIVQGDKKDVEQVIALGNVLDCLSWFIWMFENSEVNQADIDKLNQSLGLVLQVVQNQAELGKKSFNLADFPETKESVKILAKAGRAISGKNQEELKAACDHMNKAVAHVEGVMGSTDNEEQEEASKKDDEKNITENYLQKLSNSIKTNNQQQAAILHNQKEQQKELSYASQILRNWGGKKGGEK